MKFTTMCVVSALALAGVSPSELSAQRTPFRVCADPDYLPFSNRAGQGFENRIAQVVARALGQPLEYAWADTRGRGGFGEFLGLTLDAKKCDAVMGLPYGNREELTTQPYYVSSYVFVFKKSKGYDLTSMDSPILRKIKIGLEGDTPVEDGVKIRGMLDRATVFDVGVTSGMSPSTMLDALNRGDVDVIITWQPAIGQFLSKYPDLQVVSVPNARTLGSPEQYTFPMSMGVRHGDDALRKRLDQVIAERQSELTAILTQFGVRLYTP
ncbi:MAG TPA: transporter substrate-binding domain-containing protein [Vicinamibacterales bacterium]|jgi:mxaJ protein|nr:transporter substrate-binding domain-containing protein [Vicinamibacterales bacterium]